MKFAQFLALIFLAVVIAACGQKGPLVMPDAQKHKRSVPALPGTPAKPASGNATSPAPGTPPNTASPAAAAPAPGTPPDPSNPPADSKQPQ